MISDSTLRRMIKINFTKSPVANHTYLVNNVIQEPPVISKTSYFLFSVIEYPFLLQETVKKLKKSQQQSPNLLLIGMSTHEDTELTTEKYIKLITLKP